MPEYDVILTRDVSESVVLRVTAENVSDAEAVAIDKSSINGDDVEGWELDEGNFTRVYPTDVSIVKE